MTERTEQWRDVKARAVAQLTRAQRWQIERSRAVRLLLARCRRDKASGHTEWMNWCVPYYLNQGRPQDQAIATCLHIFEDFGDKDEAQAAPQLSRQPGHDVTDEPRDPHGQWTGGGEDDETPEAKLDRIVSSVPGAKEKIAAARAQVAKGASSAAPLSEGGFMRPNGLYTAARQQAHAAILDKTFSPEKVAAARAKPGEQPVAHLLGGSGGSGKGWFTKPDGTVKTDNAIYLNSDDIKAALPGYAGWNAPLLHEESSKLHKLTEQLAQAGRMNVIIDGTMGDLGGLKKRVEQYKQAGYRVEGHFMRVTPETSAKRALQRFVRGGETGRYVPPDMLLKHAASNNFEQARGKMDAWEMYDNEGDKPKFVDRG
jgi:predicted ABC-type ATPase